MKSYVSEKEKKALLGDFIEALEIGSFEAIPKIFSDNPRAAIKYSRIIEDIIDGYVYKKSSQFSQVGDIQSLGRLQLVLSRMNTRFPNLFEQIRCRPLLGDEDEIVLLKYDGDLDKLPSGAIFMSPDLGVDQEEIIKFINKKLYSHFTVESLGDGFSTITLMENGKMASVALVDATDEAKIVMKDQDPQQIFACGQKIPYWFWEIKMAFL